LIDFDKVETVNLAPQGYREADLGRYKVFATQEACQELNSDILIGTINERFKRSMNVKDVVFCCVDSITTRKSIWEACEFNTQFFCDGRMSAEVLRVLCAHDYDSKKHYNTTFFQPEEAHQGACTAKSTIYSSNIIAGLMIAQFTRWLRQLPVDLDLSLNLLTSELTVKD